MKHLRKPRATAARAAIAACLAAIVCGMLYVAAGESFGARPTMAAALAIAVAIGVLICATGMLLMHVLHVEQGDTELPQAPEANSLTFTPPPLERERPRLKRVK